MTGLHSVSSYVHDVTDPRPVRPEAGAGRTWSR